MVDAADEIDVDAVRPLDRLRVKAGGGPDEDVGGVPVVDDGGGAGEAFQRGVDAAHFGQQQLDVIFLQCLSPDGSLPGSMRRRGAKRGKVLENRELPGLLCCIQCPLAYIPATEMAPPAAQNRDFKE